MSYHYFQLWFWSCTPIFMTGFETVRYHKSTISTLLSDWSYSESLTQVFLVSFRINPTHIDRNSLFRKRWQSYQISIIHLLDRTETNIIFIWSSKVILGEAKPSPNITLSDQINMILGEVLSNKCFIIPATLCTPGPSHALLIQTKRPFTRY